MLDSRFLPYSTIANSKGELPEELLNSINDTILLKNREYFCRRFNNLFLFEGSDKNHKVDFYVFDLTLNQTKRLTNNKRNHTNRNLYGFETSNYLIFVTDEFDNSDSIKTFILTFPKIDPCNNTFAIKKGYEFFGDNYQTDSLVIKLRKIDRVFSPINILNILSPRSWAYSFLYSFEKKEEYLELKYPLKN